MRRDEILEVVEVKPLSVAEVTSGERDGRPVPGRPQEPQPVRA